jgi:beta-phosphoglucomutase-like phosphatase (HAD superfamily)
MSKKVVVFDMDGVIFDTVGVVTAYVASPSNSVSRMITFAL